MHKLRWWEKLADASRAVVAAMSLWSVESPDSTQTFAEQLAHPFETAREYIQFTKGP